MNDELQNGHAATLEAAAIVHEAQSEPTPTPEPPADPVGHLAGTAFGMLLVELVPQDRLTEVNGLLTAVIARQQHTAFEAGRRAAIADMKTRL